MVEGPNVSSYRNRKGQVSQNCLAVCNFDLEFIYMLSGWEGSAHDSKVLASAWARPNCLKVPQGKFYLVDCGFANRKSFVMPYCGVRYHLQEYGEGRNPENRKELYNLRHSSLRNIVERIFDIYKSHFTIFKSAPPFPYKTQAELVVACTSLHNFLRKECRSDEFLEEIKEKIGEPNMEDPSLEDEDDGYVFTSQVQQRDEANASRNQLTKQM